MTTEARIELDDDLDVINNWFYAEGLTDGLPIIPPTQTRVDALIRSADRAPDKVVASVPPTGGEATIESIAACAAMAGCLPDHMPVLLAAVMAVCAEPFNLAAIQTTTSPATPLLVINGPAATQLNFESGYSCLGSGNRSNLTVGRALRLVMQNLGGSAIGTIDKATHGFPGKISFCFAEAEQESPWSPYHVDAGFDAERSVVTAFAPKSAVNIVEFSPLSEDVLRSLTGALAAPTSFSGYLLLVLSPYHARTLAEAGWTKQSLSEHLFHAARVPLTSISDRAAQNAPADRLVALEEDGLVPVVESADRIRFVVAGGPGGNQSMLIPTFAASVPCSKAFAAAAATRSGEIFDRVQDRINSLLAADGFRVGSIVGDAQQITVHVTADEADCEDCLVPKSVLTQIMRDVAPDDLSGVEITLIYPNEQAPAAGHGMTP